MFPVSGCPALLFCESHFPSKSDLNYTKWTFVGHKFSSPAHPTTGQVNQSQFTSPCYQPLHIRCFHRFRDLVIQKREFRRTLLREWSWQYKGLRQPLQQTRFLKKAPHILSRERYFYDRHLFLYGYLYIFFGIRELQSLVYAKGLIS